MREKGLIRAKQFSWDGYRTSLWRAFNGEVKTLSKNN
jgi:hypothetical protein